MLSSPHQGAAEILRDPQQLQAENASSHAIAAIREVLCTWFRNPPTSKKINYRIKEAADGFAGGQPGLVAQDD